MNSPQSARSFASLGVPTPVIAALAADGVTAPFPIQTATLIDSLSGKDLLGRGKTGSGKTIAFAIPLVAALAKSGEKARAGSPRGLVLVPTRELANQVAATIAPLAKAMHLRVTVVYGGVGFGNQTAALRQGVDIVVACPGRLEDLMQQGHCRLDRVEVAVLDEADHMSDMGFLPGVKRIMDRTPKGGQRMLFSATLDNDVKVIIDRYMVNPVTHALDPADSPVEAMTHHLMETALGDKLGVVTRLAAGADRSLLFTRTKHGAKKLVRQLGQSGIPAVELHGNLSQNARERNLADFSSGQVKVLVATDIAARGIHVDDIRLVVHVDPPAEHKAFLHRSGRTARAGAEGLVVTIVTPDQRKDVRSMTRAAGIKPIVTEAVHSAHPMLEDLAGPAQPARRITHTQSQPLAERGPRSAGRQGQRAGAHRSGTARSGQARSGAPREAARTDSGRPARVTADGRPPARALPQVARPAHAAAPVARTPHADADGCKDRGMRIRQPRIQPVTEADWTDDSRPILAANAQRGPVLNVFGTIARHPKLLKRWTVFANHVLNGSTLPPRERELVILRTGYLCRSGYEWTQHVAIGLQAGLTDAEIATIVEGPDAASWSGEDRMLLRAADQLVGDHFIDDATWTGLAATWSEQQLMDLVFAVGQYTLVSMALNTFGVQLEETTNHSPTVAGGEGFLGLKRPAEASGAESSRKPGRTRRHLRAQWWC